jgi:asparagine synthase (glutamine-hydrolysing)
MCGIVGSFDYGRGAGRVTPGLIEAMGDAIAHRGPDGRGSFISTDARIGLGHRRLAIVDPEGGAQPMYGAGGVCVVFNGEIYNYPALRAELEADGARFATRCDTEVLLHLYERRGDAMVDALVGMFAFALWDPARERLLFARDPMGEKPLYWADTGGTLVFGSEIKALLEHPAVGRAVNAAAIPAYLAHLVTPSPHTLFDGIAKLPPGTMGVCDEGGVRLRRFATLPPTGSGPAPTPGEAAETVRALLGRSLDDRLMSDVPVGVLLSGGLDSTTLVALLAERGRSLATFSVGFDGSDLDEREEAAWVAKRFGTEHHEITVTEADAIGFLPKLIHHQDEPLADPVCVPLSFVCGLAREEGVKVVLAGEGADELFWGYPRYRQVLSQWPLMRALLGLPGPVRSVLPLAVPKRKAHLRELLEGLADGRPAALHSPLGLTRLQREALLRDPADTLAWTPPGPPHPDPLAGLVADTHAYELGLRLPELLLMRIDRFSMANGVEARVPFLDPELVRYVAALPLEHKLRAGLTKVVLREAVADIVPGRVLARAKQGFGAPIMDWFSSRMGTLLGSLMEEDAIREWFDVPALRAVLAGHADGSRPAPFTLWPVLNFALWHKRWIEDQPLEPMLEPLTAGRL